MRLLPRSSPLPLHRRWIADIIHFGKKSHVVGADLVINVAPIAAARKVSPQPVSWVAIWLRAMALAARKWPELRTFYLPFPWPRLYVHPYAVGSVAIEREWKGAQAVLFHPVEQLDTRSVREIDEYGHGALKEAPVEMVGGFRHIIRIARLPLPMRRLLLSIPLHWSGRLRARYFGSFTINSLVLPRFKIIHNVTPTSFLIYYGLLEPNGDMGVQVFWDHRLIDALALHRMLRDIEAIMNTDVVAELTAG